MKYFQKVETGYFYQKELHPEDRTWSPFFLAIDEKKWNRKKTWGREITKKSEQGEKQNTFKERKAFLWFMMILIEHDNMVYDLWWLWLGHHNTVRDLS